MGQILCRNCKRPIHSTSIQWRFGSFHHGDYIHTGGGRKCWISREIQEVAEPMGDQDVVDEILKKYSK